jgi:hypothetical protein
MKKLFHPLLVMIAKATSTELQQYIDYLKAENPPLFKPALTLFHDGGERPVAVIASVTAGSRLSTVIPQ